MYLVQQYGKDDSLFPKDPKKQALVNQRLYFDVGTLYPTFADQYVSTDFNEIIVCVCVGGGRIY